MSALVIRLQRLGVVDISYDVFCFNHRFCIHVNVVEARVCYDCVCTLLFISKNLYTHSQCRVY